MLATIWGSSFMLIALSLREFTPAQVVSGRLLLGGAFLFVAVLLTGQSIRGIAKHWKWLLLITCVNYSLPFYLVAWAQQSVSSSMTAIMMSGIPLFTLLMTRLFLGVTISAKRWLGFVVGCVGLLWLAGVDSLLQFGQTDSTIGQLVLLVACLLFATGSVIIRRMPVMPSLPATAVLLSLGGLVLLPFGGGDGLDTALRILKADWSASSPAMLSLLALIFLALIPTGLGQFLRTFTIQLYGPVFYSIVSYLVPIVATLLGVFVLNESMSWQSMAAFALIFCGLLLAHDGGFKVHQDRR